MKKIFVSMIVIIELLCFCNTTIAMAMSNTDTTEVQQESNNSVDSNTTVQDEQDKIEETIETEEKIQEENEILEFPEQEKNVLEETVDIKEEDQENLSSNELAENMVKEEKREENQIKENVSDLAEENEELNNNETVTNDTPDNPDDDKVVTLTFPYNNTTYSVELSSKELGVNLDDYAYYFVKKESYNDLTLYCSNERIKVSYRNYPYEEYRINGGENTLIIKVELNGKFNVSTIDLKNKYKVVYKKDIVASNQNLYYSGDLVFSKNCGYEYNTAKEKTETVNEIVKVTQTINVYKKPALNYDIIATIVEGMTVKRIKKSVNEVNGKVWDKVELSNGEEAYIISENIEVVTDTKEISFKYGNKTYRINLAQSTFGVDLNAYAYYFVEKAQDNLLLYCSNERIKVSYRNYPYEEYGINGGENTLVIKIEWNGTLNVSTIDLKDKYKVVDKKNIVASNQNLYYSGDLIFSKNCGYEYNMANEGDETWNEFLKVTKNIDIYEKPALNYDIVATIVEGMTVKRIKKSVNEINGKMWDKVELSNGEEAYIISENVEVVTDTKEISFKYGNKTYRIYLSQSEFEVDLNDYAYYFVEKEYDNLVLYCSNERMILTDKNVWSTISCKIVGGEKTIKIVMASNKILSKEIFNLKANGVFTNKDDLIATNQNLYHGSDFIFARNCGYEYNMANEGDETWNEFLRVTKNIDIYEKPALNYDIIATVQQGMVVKRTKKLVNRVNGKIWDKVELSNGEEGYIISENIEVVTDTKEISFKYGNKTYRINLAQSTFGVDLNAYAYYFVEKAQDNLLLYCSNERIKVSYRNYPYEEYGINGGENTLVIKIEWNGTLNVSTIDLKDKYKVVDKKNIVASNQNLYYSGDLIFAKNCGYEYDATKEKAETVNEIVKVTKKINVYEKPALNYDIIATVEETIVKRVKSAVNVVNGHVWDKVILSDGIEGYICSDETELTDSNNIKTIKIPYKDNIFTLYLSLAELGVDFNEYKYYYVVSSQNELVVYYSKTELNTYCDSGSVYKTKYGTDSLKISFNMQSGQTKYSILNEGYSTQQRSQYVVTNHFDTARMTISHIAVYDEINDIIYEENIYEIAKSTNTIKAITEGEKLHNSMTAIEREEKMDDLSNVSAVAQTAAYAAQRTIWPNAGSALLYFITMGDEGKTGIDYPYEVLPFKSGHTMRMISIDDKLIQEEQNKIIDSVINAIEAIEGIKDGEEIYFANVQESSGTVTKECSKDWYNTIHNYRIKIKCNVTKENDTYNLKLRFGIEDYYDWENSDKEIFYNIPEFAADRLYELNRAGIARNYTNFGEITFDIQWQRGQRSDSDNIILTKYTDV